MCLHTRRVAADDCLALYSIGQLMDDVTSTCYLNLADLLVGRKNIYIHSQCSMHWYMFNDFCRILVDIQMKLNFIRHFSRYNHSDVYNTSLSLGQYVDLLIFCVVFLSKIFQQWLFV